MQLGFQTWKDLIEVVIVPLLLGVIALTWPALQQYYRKRSFSKLIFSELKELHPEPMMAKKENAGWWEHQKSHIIHKKIIEKADENRDFILSLSPDFLYDLSQLWSAMETKNGKKWLYYLDKIDDKHYGKGNLKNIYREWHLIITEYELLSTGRYDM